MEIGDYIMIGVVFFAILIGTGYLQKHSPSTYAVIDNTWTKISTGAYDLVNGFVLQMKTPTVKTNTTEAGANG
jgi:hypothetical protein